jgi:hypothetical protein
MACLLLPAVPFCSALVTVLPGPNVFVRAILALAPDSFISDPWAGSSCDRQLSGRRRLLSLVHATTRKPAGASSKTAATSEAANAATGSLGAHNLCSSISDISRSVPEGRLGQRL